MTIKTGDICLLNESCHNDLLKNKIGIIENNEDRIWITVYDSNKTIIANGTISNEKIDIYTSKVI